MKKRLPLGLVVEGKIIDSAVLRLSKVIEELGPVKSADIRVACRVSNFLRAGYAIRRFEDLQGAGIVLLHLPEQAVPRAVKGIKEAGIALETMSFILCTSWLSSQALEPLAREGAKVASLVETAAAERNWFVMEGDPQAMRPMRRLIEQSHGRAFELRSGSKPLYFAAELLATTLPGPFFLAAEEALRTAGISGNHLHILLREVGEKFFRQLLKGGRRAAGGPLSETSTETAEDHLRELREKYPHLAAILDRELAWAAERLRGRPAGGAA
jgi:predicted short-subunit dehydrogenase-like oxidoreductase (DUF2520 family)